MILLLVPLSLISLILGLIIYARWNYGRLDNLGFPVIKPTFMFGSVPDIHLKVQHYEDINRGETYGRIWGLYQGRTPIIFVADPDLIKDIFVKDSSHFFDREPFDFGSPIVNQILDYLPGEKWKTMRVSQTKLFSSGKIKHYSNEIFRQSMGDFIKKMDEEIESSPDGGIVIDARDRFCTYTVDAIGRSMLSLKVEPDGNPFYTGCKKLIGDGQTITPFYIWTLVFPFLSRFEPTLVLDPALVDTFSSVLSSRKSSGVRYDDYADVLLDLMTKLDTPHFKNLGITQTTLWGQTVNLFLAGFDRISTTLTFLAYHLALNPSAQETLQEEIDSVSSTPNYETLSSMPYLNACISEVFRMYPTFIRPERVCNKTWVSKDGSIRIPEGITVQIPSWSVNRNSKYYEDPHDFQPNRFLPENKGGLNPYALTSFGFGHRVCIGQRFAQEAMRIGVFNLFKNYHFLETPETRVNFKPGIIMIMQYDPVFLRVVKRH